MVAVVGVYVVQREQHRSERTLAALGHDDLGQAGQLRRDFTPRLRFKSYDELNAWLLDKCLAWAKAHAHPERPERTIWEVFEEERPKLIPYRGRFAGFHALPASVSKTCPCALTTTGTR